MIKCENCGAEIDIMDEYCPVCGASNETIKDNMTYGSYGRTECNLQSDIYEEQNVDGVAVLAYFGLFVIIPIIKSKDSDFVRFHANQGIILNIFSIICFVIMYGLYNVSSLYLGNISEHSQLIATVTAICAISIFIVLFVCWVVPLVGVFHGMRRKAPIIGNIRILK